MHHLRKLVYEVHPYQWPTIGADIQHIEDAKLQDVKDFFFKFYRPNNATLVVAGRVEEEEVRLLAEKWFGPIPSGDVPKRNLPMEKPQQQARRKEVSADVPMSAIYKAYPMEGRLSDEFYPANLLTDILGHGKSSRLVDKLVKNERIFHSLHAYVTGSSDPGLLLIEGKVNEGISVEEAEEKLMSSINDLIANGFEPNELQKVKNQAETAIAGAEIDILNRAINLAYFTLLGDPDGFDKELEKVQAVSEQEIVDTFRKLIRPEKENTLIYRALPKN